ncbi:MAG: MarR family transcriptional regulator [Bacteroidetes bacterium]|nr:MAG: MarR family transcriptional regulator [Bacteroidota bacterium]
MKIEQEIRQKKFRNDWQKAVINLIFTSSWLQLKMKDFMKGYGITPQQYNVLKILKGQHPNPVSTNLVRDRMLDKMSDVSRIVARLQEKGLVDVCRACHDKRLVDIVISEKGLALVAEIDSRDDEMDGFLKKINKEEAAELSRLLDKMRG